MRSHLLQTSAIVVVLLGGAVVAGAQQPSPPADAQQQSQQEKAQQTPSGKLGTEEPSSNAPTVEPLDDRVLVDGALAVPGAPADTETAPAKFSRKNAADDELIIVAYTFKLLTDEQRRAIYASLKDQPAGSALNADIGVELPLAIELRAVPDELVSRVPQTQGYEYAVANNRVLLVSPPTRIVVGVFPSANESVGAGPKTP